MDHKEAVERNISGLYMKQELSPEDEAAFEEHLLYCEECRKNLEMLEITVKAIERNQINRFRGLITGGLKVPGITNKGSFLLRMAAILLLLFGIAGAITILIRRDRTTKYSPDTAGMIIDSVFDTVTIIRTNKIVSAPTDRGKEDEYRVIYADNFIPSPFFENIVQNKMRDKGFRVISPVNDTLAALPVFKWADQELSGLILVVFNNREAEIYKGQIVNGSKAVLKINPGLYYWQLQDDHEVLVTGRFIYYPSVAQ